MNDTSETTRLGAQIPGMTSLAGIPSADVIGNVLWNYLMKHGRLTWDELAKMNSQEIALVPRIGPVQLQKIIKAVKRCVADLPEVTTSESEGSGIPPSATSQRQVITALVDLASWFVADGREGSLLSMLQFAVQAGDPGLPADSIAALAAIDVTELADEDLVRVHDPRSAALQLIGEFDDRELQTLDRILDFDGSARTLGAIGTDLGVSRERVRQIEKQTRAKLTTRLSKPSYRSIGVAAKRFRLRFGSAIPEAEMLPEFEDSPPSLLDRLILHVAGPYRLQDGWFALEEVTPLSKLVRESFIAIAPGSVTSIDELGAALDDCGIHDRHVGALLASAKLHRFNDSVIDWAGSLGEKAAGVLRAHGTPMTIDELVESVRPRNPGSLGGQLNADAGIMRTGLKRYGLIEWNLDTFEGTAREMSRRLQLGPRSVEELADEIAEEFGVSRTSVRMFASTHPQFLLEEGEVRIRPADQPYVPRSRLEETRGCFLVDGVWALKITVDHDAVRGSGRQIPEAFALHLGLNPLEKSKVESPVGPISLGWGQYPSIGSVRSLVKDTGASEGDFMFLKRIRSSAVEVKLVPLVEGRGVEDLLRSGIGADNEGSLEQVLADALGLKGTVNHSFAEEREALAARREYDLVELLDEYVDQKASASTAESAIEPSIEGPRRGLW